MYISKYRGIILAVAYGFAIIGERKVRFAEKKEPHGVVNLVLLWIQ